MVTYGEYQESWATEEEEILYMGKSLKLKQVITFVTWESLYYAQEGRPETITITHHCSERVVGEVQLCCGYLIPVGKNSFELARQHRPLQTQERKEHISRHRAGSMLLRKRQ